MVNLSPDDKLHKYKDRSLAISEFLLVFFGPIESTALMLVEWLECMATLKHPKIYIDPAH